MNFTTRVVATAALLASFTAAASAALLDDPAAGSAGNTFAADTNHDPQLTMARAFLANGSPLVTTAGQPLIQPYAVANLAADTLGFSVRNNGIEFRSQATVTLPRGITLEQPKPRASTPYYLLRDRSAQSAGR